MKPLYRILAVMALTLKALASSASAAITIANEMYPRQFPSSCSTSLLISTSTYLVYQPEVFSNPPEVGGPAWSTRTTGTGLYATRTGTATHTVSFCEQTTTQAFPATSQEPSTGASTSAAPTTVTSTISPVTVTLRVPERKEVETSTQPSPTSSEAVTEPDQTPTERLPQDIISTCAVTSAPSATVPITFNPDSDLTWGCPPGTNCDPPKPQLCEAWTDSPADEFTCQAAHCQPAKALILGGGNEDGKFPLNEGYFDLDPSQFGLGFDIFVRPDLSVRDTHRHPRTQLHNETHGPGDNDQPSPDQARDLSSQLIPAACFETCNNAYLEAQSTGKGPRLCRPESAFTSYYLGCDRCVDHNAEQTTGALGFITGSSYLSGKFSQFLRYCKVSGNLSIETVSSNLPSFTVGAGSHGGQTPRASSSSTHASVSVAGNGISEAGATTPTLQSPETLSPGAAIPGTAAERVSSVAAEKAIAPSPQLLPSSSPTSPLSPSSTQPAGDTIVPTGPLPLDSIAAPLRNDQTSDGAVTSHNVHSSTAANVSVVSKPTGPVVLVAGSPKQRTNSLAKFGAYAFAIIASAFLV